MMKACGTYHLWLALWPTVAATANLRSKVVHELDFLVEKQWSMWRTHPQCVSLPMEYVHDNDKGHIEFAMACKEQLNRHLMGVSTTIQHAKEHFADASQKLEVFVYVHNTNPCPFTLIRYKCNVVTSFHAASGKQRERQKCSAWKDIGVALHLKYLSYLCSIGWLPAHVHQRQDAKGYSPPRAGLFLHHP